MNELVVKNVADLQTIGRMFESSGMFGCTQQGQGLVLAMTCIMEHVTPLQFMNTYHIIGGRPTMKADAMLAQFQKLGGKSKIVLRTPEEASVILEFQNEVQGFKFTFEEAKKEKFPYKKDGITFKDNWSTPRMRMQMLWARVVSDGIRAICPQVNYGRYTPEEIQDIESDNTVSVRAEVVKENCKCEADISPEIIPIGKYKGQKWDELTTDQLTAAFKTTNKNITLDMKDVIANILNSREEGGNVEAGNNKAAKLSK